jgi:hypothetical protein
VVYSNVLVTVVVLFYCLWCIFFGGVSVRVFLAMDLPVGKPHLVVVAV